MNELTGEMLLNAYANGYFPMAESRHARGLRWFSPDPRCILPLDSVHLPRSLKRFLTHEPFEIRISTAFEQVIRACADAPRRKEGTWINDDIIALYCDLARRGFAHSVECWRERTLAGGLYGVSLGGAFFGESMFSAVPNASKTALAHLIARLRAAGYRLLDVQYKNPHIAPFGCVDIAKADYLLLLENALNTSPNPSSRFLTASLSKP